MITLGAQYRSKIDAVGSSKKLAEDSFEALRWGELNKYYTLKLKKMLSSITICVLMWSVPEVIAWYGQGMTSTSTPSPSLQAAHGGKSNIMFTS